MSLSCAGQRTWVKRFGVLLKVPQWFVPKAKLVRATSQKLQSIYALLTQKLLGCHRCHPTNSTSQQKELQAPYDLVRETAERRELPVVMFTAGGVATPADAAMMMQLGADGVFVGSGIFKSGEPAKRAAAIVRAVAQFDDPTVIADASRGLGEAMVGINVSESPLRHIAWRNVAGSSL